MNDSQLPSHLSIGTQQGNDEVRPGPCPPKGCPEPTEIVCIETNKVYDFCFQRETREIMREARFPGINFRRDFDVFCEPVEFICEEVEREPVDDEDLMAVTLRVSVTIEVCVVQERRGGQVRERCREFTVAFMKTIILCAPFGTEIDCDTFSSAECECFVTPIDGDAEDVTNVNDGDADVQQGRRVRVECTVSICLITQSVALVKLLVPSFGFCTPAPCVEAPEVFECPPEPLFPPQCEPPDNNN